jgi:hypothetical protein
MAEVNSEKSALTSQNNTSTRDVIVNTISIITARGEVIDISSPPIYNVLNIYEDIFKSCITGTIQIFDGINLISKLQFRGNEFIRISFQRPREPVDSIKFDKIYRIYKVSNRQPTKSQDQTYVLHFCSEEQIFSNQINISKAYTGKTVTDYILSICRENLKIQEDKLGEFEPSSGIQKVIVPRISPFDAIKLMEKKAYNDTESPYLFFENKDGYNFASLSRLFARGAVTKLTYDGAKMAVEKNSPYVNSTTILDFNIKKSIDLWETTKKLTYSGKLSTLDLVRQKYTEYEYTAANLNKNNFIDKANLPVGNSKNRDNKSVYDVYDSNYYFSLTNKDHSQINYRNTVYRETDTNVERVLLQRESQLNLLNNIFIDSCTVPGNMAFSVGYVVELDLPGFTVNSQSNRELDPYLSGNYLITNVRHVIVPSGGHQTILSLAKNSLKTSVGFSDSSSENFIKARSL